MPETIGCAAAPMGRACVCVCVCVCVSVRACACVCLNNNAGSCFVTLFLVHSYIRPARDNHHVIKCASSLTLSPCVAGQCLPVTCGEADIERQFGLFVAGLNTYLTSNHTIANHTFNLNYTLPPLRVEVSIEVCVCVCAGVCVCVCRCVCVCTRERQERESSKRSSVGSCVFLLASPFLSHHPATLRLLHALECGHDLHGGALCRAGCAAGGRLRGGPAHTPCGRPGVCVCVCVWL